MPERTNLETRITIDRQHQGPASIRIYPGGIVEISDAGRFVFSACPIGTGVAAGLCPTEVYHQTMGILAQLVRTGFLEAGVDPAKLA